MEITEVAVGIRLWEEDTLAEEHFEIFRCMVIWGKGLALHVTAVKLLLVMVMSLFQSNKDKFLQVGIFEFFCFLKVTSNSSIIFILLMIFTVIVSTTT